MSLPDLKLHLFRTVLGPCLFMRCWQTRESFLLLLDYQSEQGLCQGIKVLLRAFTVTSLTSGFFMVENLIFHPMKYSVIFFRQIDRKHVQGVIM